MRRFNVTLLLFLIDNNEDNEDIYQYPLYKQIHY